MGIVVSFIQRKKNRTFYDCTFVMINMSGTCCDIQNIDQNICWLMLVKIWAIHVVYIVEKNEEKWNWLNTEIPLYVTLTQNFVNVSSLSIHDTITYAYNEPSENFCMHSSFILIFRLLFITNVLVTKQRDNNIFKNEVLTKRWAVWKTRESQSLHVSHHYIHLYSLHFIGNACHWLKNTVISKSP